MTQERKVSSEAGSSRHLCCSLLIMQGAIGVALLQLTSLLQGKPTLCWDPASPAWMHPHGARRTPMHMASCINAGSSRHMCWV